jgi:hypothetical protein
VEEREFRPTIYKVWNRSSVLSFDDAMFMNKVKVSMSPVGSRSKGSYVFANIDFDDGLLLADLVLNNLFTKVFPFEGSTETDVIGGKFVKYGGSKSSQQYGGRPECRILEILALGKKDTEQTPEGPVTKYTPRWKVTIKVGEGVVDPEKGTIKAKDYSNMSVQIFYVTNEQMRKLMLRLKLHLETYFSIHFAEMYDSRGNLSTDFRDDVFKSSHRSAGGEDRSIPSPSPVDEGFDPTPPTDPFVESASSFDATGMVDL